MVKLCSALISELVPGKDLQDIEVLDVKNMQIDEIEDISNCFSLRRLDLKGNEITDITGLVYNKQLLWLSLESNKLKKLSQIYRLAQLKVLKANKNKIKVCSGLEDLKDLQALVLNNNKISSMRDLGALTNLNTLVISHNRLTTLENIGQLKNLKKLSATNNQIAFFPDHISIHSGWGLHLQELRLSHNLFTMVPPCIKHCPLLKILDMGHNQLFEWKNVEAVGTLVSLRNLNFAGNPICDRDNYNTIIRELCPKVKILDGIKIVDDLRRRKRKRKPGKEAESYEPRTKKPRLEEPKKKEKKSKDKNIIAPTIIRGRVSTGKRVVLDDSDDENSNEIEDQNRHEDESPITKSTSDNKSTETREENTINPDGEKEVKKSNITEDSKDTDGGKDKSLEEKQKQSGVLSVVEVKKKSKGKKFSAAELSEPAIGLGECQCMSAVVFKKKRGKNKRARVVDKDDLKGEDEGLIKELVEDAKYRRELRRKAKGIEAESEEQLRKKRRLNKESDHGVMGLKTAFTMESHVPEVDVQMELYIQQKLQEKRREQVNEEQEEQIKERELDPFLNRDEILYSTPSHLQPKVGQMKPKKIATNLGNIEEVPLPKQYHIENVKETEKAKKEKESKTTKELNEEKEEILHNRFHIVKPKHSDKATDAEVAERFKKRAQQQRF